MDVDQPAFADKSHQPTDSDLARVLGRAKRHWDTFVAQVQEADAGVAAEWKFYTPKYGWTFVARAKRRNLVYLKAMAKQFLVSFAFGDKAVEAAEQADLPAEFVKSIKESRKYPEGRTVRVTVTSAADVQLAKKLLAIKIAN